jgi:TPP-dependent pyruvate/acetoin dehydrogenase alpha subunit
MHENPLVPNAKLRQMYVAMAELRLLDERIAKSQKKIKARRRIDSIRGQEAVRVSTAIELGPGDLVSDSQAGPVMDLLAGAKIGSLLERVEEVRSGKKVKTAKKSAIPERSLPWIEDVGERLRMAMGAALSFKTSVQKNVVVAYVRHGQVGKETWKAILPLASKLELPLIFVVLRHAKGDGDAGVSHLAAKAASWGVPGIPVDEGDAVALYRVAQESMGRTKGGDGPVLIECVPYHVESKRLEGSEDPLIRMREFLLSRKIATNGWLNGAGAGLRRRMEAPKQ